MHINFILANGLKCLMSDESRTLAANNRNKCLRCGSKRGNHKRVIERGR